MADGMSKLRLDKYLADMGVGTRQEVKALVRKGRVAVDGITAKAPELKVDPDEAQVTVDGNSIFLCENGILDAPQTGGCRLCDGGPP